MTKNLKSITGWGRGGGNWELGSGKIIKNPLSFGVVLNIMIQSPLSFFSVLSKIISSPLSFQSCYILKAIISLTAK